MNHYNRHTRHIPRGKTLCRALAMALAVGASGMAAAQSTSSYALDNSWAQFVQLNQFLHQVVNQQALLANVNASLPTADSIFVTANGSGNPVTTRDNQLGALAVGNSAPTQAIGSTTLAGNSIALGLLAGDATNNGLGILNAQVNSGGDITSDVTNGAVATDLTSHYTGAVTHSGNSIAATTKVNDASSHIDGALPFAAYNGSVSGTAQAALFANGGNFTTMDSAGDIAIGNAQMNYSVDGSTAVVSGSAIRVTDTPVANTPISADFSNSQNQIAARYSANSGDNGFNAASGGAVSYQGSVVLSSEQVNYYALGSATVAASGITTTLGGVFTGTLSQSGNAIVADAENNIAGNTIAFAKGIDVTGDGGTHNVFVGNSGGNMHPLVRGDLVLLNLQANWDANNAASVGAGSDILATVGAVTQVGTSVTLNADHILANTAGSIAENSISADAAAFAASVQLGSLQSIVYYAGIAPDTPTSASITGVRLGAVTSNAAQVSRGAVSVAASNIDATSTGNRVANDVTLAGTQFTSGSGGVTALSSSAGFVPAVNSGGAGIAIGNLQGNYYQPVAATVTGSWLGAEYAGAIADGSSAVTGSSISASASANDGESALNLSGDNAVVTAALANTQFNGNYGGTRGDVAAGITGTTLGVEIDAGNVASAALDMSDNAFSVSALGNRGVNLLATDFTNATLGAAANPWTTASSVINPATGSNQATSALVLASNQKNQSNTTATLDDSFMAVAVDNGNASATSVTVDANAMGASAVSNSVTNTLDPGVGTLTTTDGSATQIASLGNLQINQANAVLARVDPGAASGAIYALVNGTASNVTASVSGNTVSAFGAGSVATNAMAVSGANFAPPPAALVGITLASHQVLAAFALQSVQQSNAGSSRAATVTNGSLGVVAAGNISDSPLTVDGNAVSADARDNYASNTLGFDFMGTLATTAGMRNDQVSNAVMTSQVDATDIAAGSLNGGVSGSDVTVSSNSESSKALANTAFNTLRAHANQLNGTALAGTGDWQTHYGLASTQSRTGTIGASVTAAQVGGGADGNFSGGSVSVVANSDLALAQANSSSNVLVLAATGIAAATGIVNLQNVAAASSAAATVTGGSNGAIGVVVGGTLSGASATVTDNAITARAGANDATNRVTADATSTITAVIGGLPIGAFGGSVLGDFVIDSQQGAASGASAMLNPGYVGIHVGTGIGNATASSMSVADNTLTADATINRASNAVALNGASSIDASAALNNIQQATAGAASATATNALIGVYNDAGNVRTASLTVTGNALAASAAGNSAGNSVWVLPVALNAGAPGPTQGSVTGGGNQALARNALLNQQTNAETISATTSNSSVGIDPDALVASPLLASVATVGGNSAAASASGNSAGNQILLASLPTGVASSALVSNQMNSAAIGATVSAVQIGVNAGTNSTSPVTVSGNIISAIGVGNSATNHIGIGN